MWKWLGSWGGALDTPRKLYKEGKDDLIQNFEIYTNPRIWGFLENSPIEGFQSLNLLEMLENDELRNPLKSCRMKIKDEEESWRFWCRFFEGDKERRWRWELPKISVKMRELGMLAGYSGVGWDSHHCFAQNKMFWYPNGQSAPTV